MNYNILDLFSGAGGFSLGFDMENNFKTLLATDFNRNALSTFQKNFPKAKTIQGDITDIKTKNKIISMAKKLKINMIIGGPPCQGFSNKGKKMGLDDPRNFLFKEYLFIVKEIQPEIFIIENVKALISSSNGFFINEIEKSISELGYFVSKGILNAKDYGVPQSRERTIIIASKKRKFSLPLPQKNILTVRDAISDLSFLNSGDGENVSEYKTKYLSSYQKIMREKSNKLYNHKATQHSKETLKKLLLIPPEKGKEYLPDELKGKQLFKTTWSRLEWDKPSPTIDTRFDTPSNGKNSHPFLNRAITPREAARIQSFPDKFIFCGTKTDICTQIGNAVPPLLANSIARSLIQQMKYNDKQEQEYFKIYNYDAFCIIKEFQKKNIIVDHIITDPPYNISKENNFKTLKNPRAGVYFGNWDENFDLVGWIKDYVSILDKNGSIIIFCSYIYISDIIKELEKNSIIIKDLIRWEKTNPMPRNINRRYVQDYEFAIWGVKKGAKWVFNKPKNISYLRPLLKSSIVSGSEKNGHPTQKSLKIMEELIKIHTNEGQTILDPFMGSGSTGEACKKLNRKFIGVEVDKKYFLIAKKRLNNTLC